MPNPAFSVLQRMTDQQAPEEPDPQMMGREITMDDSLASSLANANKHLYQAIRSGAPIDEDAMAQMRVFAELIQSLGETGAPENPTDLELPGGPVSPAAPGFPAVNTGLPGAIPMGGMS